MATTVSNLPDDKDSLKEFILSLQETHTQKEQSYQAQLKFLEDEVTILSEQVRFFKASLYARKTEKLSAEELRQMFLFDEAEAVVDGITPEDKESEEIIVTAHSRKKSGRKALPESLPRVEVVHDLSEADVL